MTKDTFFTNFGYLADAPNGVKKLRELILQLAVQGKLVPQDPSDEPASILLKKIKAEKERLVKEKKIKKADSLPPVSPDEEPYKLSKGWVWVRVVDILEKLTNGYSGQQFKEPPGLPLTRIETISNGTVDFSRVGYVKDYDDELIEKFRIESKDILLSHINSEKHLGKTAVYQSDKLILHGTNLLLLRVFKFFINADYFHIVMQYSRNIGYFISMAQHAIHQASINQSKLSYTPFALPPLAEQHRIVAKVDLLMALCDELDKWQQKKKQKLIRLNNAALDRLLTARTTDDFADAWRIIRDNFDFLYTAPETITKFRQAILQLAVQGKLVPQDTNDEPASALLVKIKTEKDRLIKEKKIKKAAPLPPVSPAEAPYELPKGWEWVRLGEIIKISSGDGLTSENMDSNGQIPVYGGNGIAGYHSKFNVEKPTIVIGRVGYYCGSVHMTEEKAWITDNAFITFFSEENIFPYFMFWLLKGTNLKERENATAQPVISGKKVYPLVVGLPPLAEQHRIVTKVDQLMKLCDELESKLIKSQTKSEKLVEASVKAIAAN